MLVPILGATGGFFMGKMQVPKVARNFGSAIKKGKPILFLAGHDRKLRIIPMKAGLTGYWHDRDLETIPDDKAIYSCYGTEAGIGSSQSVSNLTPEFLSVIEAFRKKQVTGQLTEMEDVLGRKVGSTPEELAQCFYMLETRRKDIEKRIAFVKEIATDQSTMEEKIRMMGFDPDEEQRFRVEIKTAIDEMKTGKLEETTLMKEYNRIDRARKIEVDYDGWSILTIPPKDSKSKISYRLVRKALVSMDDFWHFLPTGSSMNAVWTMIRRAEQANKLESAFTEAQGFKWMIIGLTIMMASIGIGVMVYLAVGK